MHLIVSEKLSHLEPFQIIIDYYRTNETVLLLHKDY